MPGTQIDENTLVSLPVLWSILIGTGPMVLSILYVGFRWGGRLQTVERDVAKLKRHSWTIPMQKLWAAQVANRLQKSTILHGKLDVDVPDPIKDVVSIIGSEKTPSDT